MHVTIVITVINLFSADFCAAQYAGRSGVDYVLFTRSQRNGMTLTNDRLPSNLKSNLPVFFLLHGMGEGIMTPCQRKLRNALLDRGDFNVIAAIYIRSSLLYTLSYLNVAREIGMFLLSHNVSPARTYFIGLSIGAQIAGVVYSVTGFRPRIIYGLDPAGPVFDSLPEVNRLNANSADYVLVIHTNAGSLGTTLLLGNDDLYVNGGNNYPCCTSNVCKHIGSCQILLETIRSAPVRSKECRNQREARLSSCYGPDILLGFGTPLRSGRRISHLSLSTCFRISFGRSISRSSSKIPSESGYTLVHSNTTFIYS